MADKLLLTPKMKVVHMIFHVSMLHKCLSGPSRITHVEDIYATQNISCEKVPVANLDCQVRMLWSKETASVKVLWTNKIKEEMTWEIEESFKFKHPYLFHSMGGNNEAIMIGCDPTFEDECSEGGDDVTPHT